jgi:hypothetical protein
LDAVVKERIWMKLVHFYHVYADGDWKPAAEDHIEELFVSGLLDELDDMFVGIVGSKENRRKVKRKLRRFVVAEADEGWEQVTLNEVHKYAQHNDAAIFYAHTKGAWSNSELARQWRVSMTHDTVTRWQECVAALHTVEAAGPYWLKSWEPEHADHDFFFAGNFWWARSDYIRTLSPVSVSNRYQAEGWIGLNKPTVKNMRDGYSYWGNFWQPQS